MPTTQRAANERNKVGMYIITWIFCQVMWKKTLIINKLQNDVIEKHKNICLHI